MLTGVYTHSLIRCILSRTSIYSCSCLITARPCDSSPTISSSLLCPAQITIEPRYLNAKTVYALTKEGDAITGSIATSSLRLGGTWGQDQIMTAIEVVRQ